MMLLQSKTRPPPLSGGQMVQLLHLSLFIPMVGTQDFSLMIKRFCFFFSGDDEDLGVSWSNFAVEAVLQTRAPISWLAVPILADQQIYQSILG